MARLSACPIVHCSVVLIVPLLGRVISVVFARGLGFVCDCVLGSVRACLIDMLPVCLLGLRVWLRGVLLACVAACLVGW